MSGRNAKKWVRLDKTPSIHNKSSTWVHNRQQIWTTCASSSPTTWPDVASVFPKGSKRRRLRSQHLPPSSNLLEPPSVGIWHITWSLQGSSNYWAFMRAIWETIQAMMTFPAGTWPQCREGGTGGQSGQPNALLLWIASIWPSVKSHSDV